MRGNCLAEVCPTEADFCETDPECSPTTYQEPDASLKGGVIAGIVLVSVALLVSVLYLWHRHRIQQQNERIRKKFARRIAETVKLEGSTRQLSPEALLEEFQKIDAGVVDGFISKEELWEFVQSGHAGDLSESDFNALFAAIDLDDNGQVDFLEFCTFMGKCNEDFDQLKHRKSVMAARPSMMEKSASRLVVATSTTRRLSSASKGDNMIPVIEDPDDEEKGEQEEVVEASLYA